MTISRTTLTKEGQLKAALVYSNRTKLVFMQRNAELVEERDRALAQLAELREAAKRADGTICDLLSFAQAFMNEEDHNMSSMEIHAYTLNLRELRAALADREED